MFGKGWICSTARENEARRSLHCWLALIIGALIGPNQARATTWHQAQVGDYRIVSAMGAKTTAQAARNIQIYQTALRLVFPGGDPQPHMPVTIFLLDGRTWGTIFSSRGGPAGLTAVRDDHMYIFVDGTYGEDAAKIVYHELTHVFLHRNFNSSSLPAWLDEGYAELLSTLDATDDAVKVGRPAVERYLAAGRERWLPLKVLLTASRTSPTYEGERYTSAFYAQSWLTAHYMAFGNPARRKQLDIYIQSAASGKSLEEALAVAFRDDDLKKFDRELQGYSEKTGFAYWTIPTAELAKVKDAAMSEMPWNDVADEISGWLSLYSKLPPNHVKFLKKRHDDQPDNGIAAVQLAMAYLDKDRIDDARALIDKHCIEQPATFNLTYNCGEALRRLKKSDNAEKTDADPLTLKYTTYFVRAVQLQPDNLRVLLRASSIAMLSADDRKLIIDGLWRAHQRDKFNYSVAYQLATLHADLDTQKARYFYEYAIYSAPNPTALSRARAQLNELNERVPAK